MNDDKLAGLKQLTAATVSQDVSGAPIAESLDANTEATSVQPQNHKQHAARLEQRAA